MAEIRRLANPPIVEAILDVRVEARTDFRAEAFGNVRSEIARKFPKVEERRGATLQLAFGGRQPAQMFEQHGIDGLFFRSDDEKDVVQFRVDGFTFNRLAPYTSWEAIVPEALNLLAVYLSVVQPNAINRIATRYINRITLPSRRFEEFLSRPPLGVPGVDATVTGFMDVATSVERDSGAMVTYTQALEGASVQVETPSVILDIDTYFPTPCEPDVQQIAARLAILHDVKNRVFFGALSDTAVRLFQ